MQRSNTIQVLLSASTVLYCVSASAQSLSSPPVIFKSDMVRAITATEQWSQADRSWRYQTQSQMRLLVGNSAPKLSSGLVSAELGGVGLTDQWQPELFGNTLQWRYGATVGLVDHSQSLQQFKYGARAGRAWLDVTVTPGFSLGAVYQRAQGYEQLGLGTHYDLGLMGNWSFAISQSQTAGVKRGLRYQGVVDLDLNEQTHLTLSSEKYTGKFVRLGQNHRAPTSEQSAYRAALVWDTGRWGRVQAHYANNVITDANPQHILGIGQQVWYSPNVRIDLDAQRQTHSGDYNMGLRFSFPLF